MSAAETVKKTAQAASEAGKGNTKAADAPGGLRIAIAFTDRDTGTRYGPGDEIPSHILEDDERVAGLKERGHLTDAPEKSPRQRQTPGGTTTVTYAGGLGAVQVRDEVAPGGDDQRPVEPSPAAPSGGDPGQTRG